MNIAGGAQMGLFKRNVLEAMAGHQMAAVPTLSEPRAPSEGNLLAVEHAIAKLSRIDCIAEVFLRYFEGHKSRLAFDLDYVTVFVNKDARVLEIGALPFVLSCSMFERGITFEAIDKTPDDFQPALKELEFKVSQCDIERQPLPYADDDFDLITFNEVFEHLRIDLIFTMGEILRVLKPGGLLMLSTPNLRSWHNVTQLLVRGISATHQGLYESWESLQRWNSMGHVREYTPQEVAQFTEKIGFRKVGVIYRCGHQSVPWHEKAFTQVLPQAQRMFSLLLSK